MTLSSVAVPARRYGAAVGQLLRDIASRRAGLLALVLVAGLLIMVVIAPLVAPYTVDAQDIPSRLQGPSREHWLGTDDLGRDLLSRAIFGARIALSVAVPAGVLALVVGLLIGTVAGYAGGRIDRVLVVLMDSMQAFPAVILALGLLSLLGPSLRNEIIVIGVAFAPAYARMARASAFVVREEPYIQAERSLGATNRRIVSLHLLPNIIAPLFILMAINIPVAVSIEAGLSFLGLGVPPPQPSWGVMLADGFRELQDDPWPILVPGLALVLTTLGFTLLGEALRDHLDPRLSGVGGGTDV